ncbi:MAG: hypothetical protein RLN74_00995, partial [Ilumatobacter fluminis]
MVLTYTRGQAPAALNIDASDADGQTMRRTWIAPVLAAIVAVACTVAYALLDGVAWAEWLRVGVVAGAAAAVLVGIAVARPARPVPWWM